MNILSESQGRLDENQHSCAGQYRGKAKECPPCRLDSAYLSVSSSLCGCRGRDEVRAGEQPSESRAVGEAGGWGGGSCSTGSLPVTLWPLDLLLRGTACRLVSKLQASHLGCYPTGTEEESPLSVRRSPSGTGVHLYLS